MNTVQKKILMLISEIVSRRDSKHIVTFFFFEYITENTSTGHPFVWISRNWDGPKFAKTNAKFDSLIFTLKKCCVAIMPHRRLAFWSIGVCLTPHLSDVMSFCYFLGKKIAATRHRRLAIFSVGVCVNWNCPKFDGNMHLCSWKLKWLLVCMSHATHEN